jgi:DNA-binding NarL/FixJ family response regulator
MRAGPAVPRRDRIRIAIANDHPVVVRGLAAVVRAHGDRFVLVPSASGLVDDAAPDRAPVDIVIYDDFVASRPVKDYVAAVGPRVVVLGGGSTWPAVTAALEAGAAGYLYKGISEADLLAALEQVHAGEHVVALAPGTGRARGLGNWQGRELGLSPREAEILAWHCRGLTDDAIAATVMLSVEAVQAQLPEIYRKIGVGDRAQAVAFGTSHDFLPPDPTAG